MQEVPELKKPDRHGPYHSTRDLGQRQRQRQRQNVKEEKTIYKERVTTVHRRKRLKEKTQEEAVERKSIFSSTFPSVG